MSIGRKDNFFELVYEVVRLVPKGRVTSYGAIAKYLGFPRSARMVGWALNNSHQNKSIPAHRVVNRNGQLTGKMHFEPFTSMEELLASEDIQVLDNAIQDFETVFWDPTIELAL